MHSTFPPFMFLLMVYFVLSCYTILATSIWLHPSSVHLKNLLFLSCVIAYRGGTRKLAKKHQRFILKSWGARQQTPLLLLRHSSKPLRVELRWPDFDLDFVSQTSDNNICTSCPQKSSYPISYQFHWTKSSRNLLL